MFFWKSKTIIGNGIFLRETVTLPESEDLRHILRSAWTKVPEFWRTAQALWRQGSLQFHPKTSPVKKEALFYYFVSIYYKNSSSYIYKNIFSISIFVFYISQTQVMSSIFAFHLLTLLNEITKKGQKNCNLHKKAIFFLFLHYF